MRSHCQLAGGRLIDPFNPRPEDFDIETIAGSLANECRFTGNVRPFYSVAEHSIRVAQIVSPPNKLWALLHDASEIVTGDIPSWLKHQPEFAGLRRLERRIMDAVCARFGLPFEMPAEVHAADRRLMATEVRDLMRPVHPTWAEYLRGVEPLPGHIEPWSDSCVEAEFRFQYRRLTGK